jgi:hypothetical protein
MRKRRVPLSSRQPLVARSPGYLCTRQPGYDGRPAWVRPNGTGAF